MQRTQLLIEDWQYQALKARATRERRSLSNLVREILTLHLQEEQKDDPLARIEGIGADDQAAGRAHDDFLYGQGEVG